MKTGLYCYKLIILILLLIHMKNLRVPVFTTMSTFLQKMRVEQLFSAINPMRFLESFISSILR